MSYPVSKSRFTDHEVSSLDSCLRSGIELRPSECNSEMLTTPPHEHGKECVFQNCAWKWTAGVVTEAGQMGTRSTGRRVASSLPVAAASSEGAQGIVARQIYCNCRAESGRD
jgi:hypothetical protein